MAWSKSSAAASPRGRHRSNTDLEKSYHRYSEDEVYENEDYDYSEPSSRSVSSSQGLLSKALTSRPSRRMLRFPNTIMRWMCWAVALGILLFILSLVKMSRDADREVQIAAVQKKLAPKPPIWEDFPFLTRYWGGLRTLIPYDENIAEYPATNDVAAVSKPVEPQKRDLARSVVFNPYPDYASFEYVQQYGKKVNCYLDAEGKIDIPRVRVYEGRTKGFPDPVMGSNELLGMKDDICFERYGRLGPYGLGYQKSKGGSGAMLVAEREGSDAVWEKRPQVDFREVNWRDVQDRCFIANKHRFSTSAHAAPDKYRSFHVGETDRADQDADSGVGSWLWSSSRHKSGRKKVQRTAVVVRTWHDYDYSTEDLMYLRSLVSELSLLSGGEYSLHFLIHVKDNNAPIWTDDEVYDHFLNNALPAEFRGMGTLWTEKQMEFMYPNLEENWSRNLPVHGVYRSTFMPMQYFAFQHPEYDFFWNWEMDVRYTGHWYHLFDSVSKWAKKQPRKYLWERNSRFFIPTTHGSWDEFNHTTRVQTEHGTNSVHNLWSGRQKTDAGPGTTQAKGDKPVWGPLRPQRDNVAFEDDPEPPTSFDKDRYSWGVGEDADLITFNPMFDPQDTTWLLRDDTTGYNLEDGRPPRRTAIITASRLSRKLLLDMHRETSKNLHTMFSEMWPASCALHHGLKAVYAPHAEYIDRKWPLDYLQSTFNAGRNGATGASRMSVFGEREHNFAGTTWYYNAGFPAVLYQRWIGMMINNDGGEAFEKKGEGRMCTPAMLLHPIKRVNVPVFDPK